MENGRGGNPSKLQLCIQERHEMEYTVTVANTHAQITENAVASDTNTNCTTKHNHIVMMNLLDLKRNFVREKLTIYQLLFHFLTQFIHAFPDFSVLKYILIQFRNWKTHVVYIHTKLLAMALSRKCKSVNVMVGHMYIPYILCLKKHPV